MLRRIPERIAGLKPAALVVVAAALMPSLKRERAAKRYKPGTSFTD
jgi:hypothetical protein